jgi:hypothetical protein
MDTMRLPSRASDAGPCSYRRRDPEETVKCHECGNAVPYDYTDPCQGARPDLCEHRVCEDCRPRCWACNLPVCSEHAHRTADGLECQDCKWTSRALRDAKGLLNSHTPLQIGGSQHWIIVRQPGHITIGCMHHTVEWWEDHAAAVGRSEGYSDEQVAEYQRHIAYCREWMERNGEMTVATPVEAA